MRTFDGITLCTSQPALPLFSLFSYLIFAIFKIPDTRAFRGSHRVQCMRIYIWNFLLDKLLLLLRLYALSSDIGLSRMWM